MLDPFATTSRITPIHQMSLAVLSRAACASMSTTTTTTTTRDRRDRYGPMEWAQWALVWNHWSILILMVIPATSNLSRSRGLTTCHVVDIIDLSLLIVGRPSHRSCQIMTLYSAAICRSLSHLSATCILLVEFRFVTIFLVFTADISQFRNCRLDISDAGAV